MVSSILRFIIKTDPDVYNRHKSARSVSLRDLVSVPLSNANYVAYYRYGVILLPIVFILYLIETGGLAVFNTVYQHKFAWTPVARISSNSLLGDDSNKLKIEIHQLDIHRNNHCQTA